MRYFQIIRVDGSSKRYSSMIQMLQNIDKEYLETLWKLVKAKHGEVRRNLQGTQVTIWESYFSSKWSAFCKISESAYHYAGRKEISTYTCSNHRNAQQEASNRPLE
ncbi:hypothetical protein Tco_1256486 [Tanacetum coccineum]